MTGILLENALALYGLVVAGFLLGRYTDTSTFSIANVNLYLLAPVVIFGAVAQMALSADTIYPPLIIAFISYSVSSVLYLYRRKFWPEGGKGSLLAMLSVSANASYFGIPIAIALVGVEHLGTYMMMLMPLFILDASISYYYGARGHFDTKASLIKVATLPIIWGAIAGFIVNLTHLPLPDLFVTYWDHFTSALIITGMLLVGIGLGKVESFKFDTKMTVLILISRYIFWPGLGLAAIYLDVHYFQMFDTVIYSFIVLICACPIAANTVAYAAKLELYPDLAATMVAMTMVGALFAIPFFYKVMQIITAGT